jgi:hypothetical protein
MFTFLVYQKNPSVVSGTDFDIPALTDPTFTTRNNHFYFLEDYNLLGCWAGGPGMSKARLHCPTWDIFCPNEIYPANGSIFSFGSGDLDLRTDIPQPIPKEQEIRATADISGGNNGLTDDVFLWLGTPDWTRQLPRSEYIFRTRFSFTTAGGFTAGWFGPVPMTPDQTLRGGVYSVIGAFIDTIGVSSFRLIFPQMPLYRGRELRPGGRALPSTDVSGSGFDPWKSRYFGEWGRFHTFQFPQIETLNNAPGGGTSSVILTLAYLGIDPSLLQAGVRTI